METTKLTYDQALDAIDSGKYVRLPEWIGYWFNDGSGPKAFTRTGDIIDAWVGMMYVITRNDWELCEPILGFDFVINALQAGKKVTNSKWKNEYLIMVDKKKIFKVKNGEPILWIPTQKELISKTYINYYDK